VHNINIKEEIENLIEAYEDIDAKIQVYNLNYSEPDKRYDGEPDEIQIDIPDILVQDLAMLSHRASFNVEGT